MAGKHDVLNGRLDPTRTVAQSPIADLPRWGIWLHRKNEATVVEKHGVKRAPSLDGASVAPS